MDIQSRYTSIRFDSSAFLSGRCKFCVGCSHYVVRPFQGEGLLAEEIKGIPWRLLSLDDLRVVTVFESSFLGMKAILRRKREMTLGELKMDPRWLLDNDLSCHALR